MKYAMLVSLLAAISTNATAQNADRMNMAVCLDASFVKGFAVFNEFMEEWKKEVSHLSALDAEKYEFAGRDFRKDQMLATGNDRNTQREENWNSRNCKRFLN